VSARPISLHARDGRIVLRLARNGATMATLLRPMQLRDAYRAPFFLRKKG
jgi:ABC-type Na+ transport system ATPase subunit NatA